MGFPFDRPAGPKVETLHDFITPNMFLKDVVIKFNDIVKPPPYRNETTSQLSLAHLPLASGNGKRRLSTGLL